VSSTLSGASFSLTGAANLNGTTPWSTSSAPAGSYTITWNAISGYTTPASETKTLTAGGSISFNGVFQAQTTPLSFTNLTPPTVTSSQSTYDATLTATGTNFNNVNRVTFSWVGPDSGSDTWDRGTSEWNKVTVNSNASMTLRPNVLYNESGTQTKTWT